jgi:hypothetical protein
MPDSARQEGSATTYGLINKESDHWHRRLLRVDAERPSGRRAAEKADELAPSH